MAEDAADRLVARAIESVLEQVPGSIDSTVPEAGAAKLQPWAETAAPVGRNKRPLEELLDELEQRVTADPDARATLPRTRHPAIAFFDRFGRGGRGQPAPDGGPTPAEGGGKRRRRRRGGGTGGQPATREAAAATTPAPGERPASGRRRSRRGRGGGGGGGAGGREGPMAGGQGTPATPANPPRAPGTGGGGRRRRGRRGRGSAGGDGGGPPAGG
jgi:translation initiation factor IF-2